MAKRISIGTWAYIFNQETPTNDFTEIVRKLKDLGYDGVELGGFDPHPGPHTCDTPQKRRELRAYVEDHGLAFSGLAADLWSQKLWSVEDQGPFFEEYTRNVEFANDLGIGTVRVDTVEPVTRVAETGIDPKVVFDRCARAFDRCAKIAADKGLRVCWEFEPGFPINKPSEILGMVDAVRSNGNDNFGVLFDTCHAHMCAKVGANQIGEKETLPGGEMELLEKLRGKITHVHLIDSDGTLNEHNTSTHNPFGTGNLNFDELLPALSDAQVPNDWWCVDLCFWPNAWDVTAQSKTFLDRMRAKYA